MKYPNLDVWLAYQANQNTGILFVGGLAALAFVGLWLVRQKPTVQRVTAVSLLAVFYLSIVSYLMGRSS